MTLRNLPTSIIRRSFAVKPKPQAQIAYRKGGGLNLNARVSPASLSTTDRRVLEMLRPIAPPPEKTDEEKAAYRKEMVAYGKLKRKQHLEMEKVKNRLLLAKWRAIDALPKERRREALETKPEPFPDNMPVQFDTPPIEGWSNAEMTETK